MQDQLRLAGVAAVGLLAAGCFWPAPGAGPGRDAHNVFEDQITLETVGDLEEIWRAQVAPTSWDVGHPVTSEGNVHVVATDTVPGDGDQGSALVAVDRDTGELSWSSPISPQENPVEISPPVFANDVIWLGYVSEDGSGTMRHLDPDTGDVLPTPPGAQGLVNGVRGDLYLVNIPNVPTSSGTAHRVAVQDLTDPGGVWEGSIDTVPPGETAEYSPLTLGNDYVFQAGPGTFWDGSAPGSGFSRGNGIRGYSVEDPVDDCSPGGPLPFICPTWSTELDGTTATPPVLAHGGSGTDDAVVYTVTNAGFTGTLYAVDATNGDILWSRNLGTRVVEPPALANGILYVATAGDHLLVYDADDGDALGEGLFLDDARQPAVVGDVLFIAAREEVQAFDADDCATSSFCDSVWSENLVGDPGWTEAITGAPAIDRGQLYVGTTRGRLIAFGLG